MVRAIPPDTAKAKRRIRRCLGNSPLSRTCRVGIAAQTAAGDQDSDQDAESDAQPLPSIDRAVSGRGANPLRDAVPEEQAQNDKETPKYHHNRLTRHLMKRRRTAAQHR